MKGSSLSRRKFLMQAAAVGAGMALAACAPAGTPAAPQPTAAGETPAPAPKEAVTIEIWNANWGELYNDLMKRIGDEFEAEHPEIKLQWSFNDEWQEKWLTAVAAGIPPDCGYTNWEGLATLAHGKAVIALDDYFAASGIKPEDFVTSMIKNATYEGKIYAIPGGCDYDWLLYNKTVYEEAGLDPEKPPVTFDEWVQHSEKIYQYDSAGNITRMGMDPRAGGLYRTGFQFGGEFYDEANRKVTCNEGGVVKALEFEVELAKKWPVEKVSAFTAGLPGYSQPNSGFATGKQAYLYPGGAFWAMESFDKYAPDLKYGAAFIPTLTPDPKERELYMWIGWHYSIPTGAKNKDAAWQFMKYAFYDKAARMGVVTLNGCCVKAQLTDWVEGLKDYFGPDNRVIPYLPILGEIAAVSAKYWPPIPVASRYLDEVNRAEDFAVRGEKTAQQALDECAEIVQKELEAALKGS